MSKINQMLALQKHIEIISKLECFMCSKTIEIHSLEAIDYFYSKGWRVSGTDCCLCPKCEKNRNN